eukprot:14470220-Ditylum_brightwellii.AAC.1
MGENDLANETEIEEEDDRGHELYDEKKDDEDYSVDDNGESTVLEPEEILSFLGASFIEDESAREEQHNEHDQEEWSLRGDDARVTFLKNGIMSNDQKGLANDEDDFSESIATISASCASE